MKRLFSCIIAFIILIASLPFAAAAEEENYVWVLKDIIEYDKAEEIDDYNDRNAETFSLDISVSQGSFEFSLEYLGASKNQDGRQLKEGDSAASSVVFGNAPKTIQPGELISLSVDLKITGDNTYDKAYDFLPTKASAFFDKAEARPDIPSSNAVYFAEKEGEEKGTAVGTKSGLQSSISTSLYATAPKINDERKMALYVRAEGILIVGTKYVYELVNENDIDEEEFEQAEYRKAFVKDITGSVFGVNESKAALKDNDEISSGTTIKTEADSGCELYFDDNSFFRISADSELLLSKAEVKETVIKIVNGKAWAYIQPVAYGGSLTIDMKYADLKIKGTIFAIEEGEDYSTIWMFTGYASVISANTGELIDLEAGEKITFDKDGAELQYFNITENIEQWGIPISAIREDSGYAWVKYLIIGLAVFTVAVITAIILTIYLRKRRKKKAISDVAPEEGQCQFCGGHLEQNDIFCPNCGAAVKKSKNPEDAIEQPSQGVE